MKSSSHEKILESLSALLPEDAREKINSVLSSFLEEATNELQEQFNKNLEEAYATIAAEHQSDCAIAEQGYSEAYEIISDLRDRLEIQKEEFQTALEEGYEEAYQMLLQERGKNGSIEVDLYEEYDKKLNDIKEFMVDKVDQFLSKKGDEFYMQAKRDVMNDPCMAEHKVALDRILEVACNYLSDEDYAMATSSKVDTLNRQLDEVRSQMRVLEARNTKLHTDNTKLNEVVKHAQKLITESTKVESKERVQKAKNAQSRGKREMENVEVIGEHKQPANATVANENLLSEEYQAFAELRRLANVPEEVKK